MNATLNIICAVQSTYKTIISNTNSIFQMWIEYGGCCWCFFSNLLSKFTASIAYIYRFVWTCIAHTNVMWKVNSAISCFYFECGAVKSKYSTSNELKIAVHKCCIRSLIYCFHAPDCFFFFFHFSPLLQRTGVYEKLHSDGKKTMKPKECFAANSSHLKCDCINMRRFHHRFQLKWAIP